MDERSHRVTWTPDMARHVAPDEEPYEYATATRDHDTWRVTGWFRTEREADQAGGAVLAVEDPDELEGGIK